MKKFITGVFAEIKKVKWPTMKELIGLLLFTVVTCGIIAVLMLGLDVFFLRIQDILLNL